MSHNRLNVVLGDQTIVWPFLIGAIQILSSDFEGLAKVLRLGCEAAGLPDNTEDSLAGFYQLQCLEEFRGAFREGKSCPDLEQVLTMARLAKATDSKDKVYGILGLLDPDIARLITPDYDLTLEDIYIDFAAAIIKSTGRLDVILFHGRYDASERLLPS